jgi:hypothetical protein
MAALATMSWVFAMRETDGDVRHSHDSGEACTYTLSLPACWLPWGNVSNVLFADS